MAENPKREATHYDHLMVGRQASLDVIRAAYRTLTQKYHPDRNPGDAEATRLMQLINESYAVLCDPEKRKAYDRRLAEDDEHNLQLALEARQNLVPVLQEATPARRHRRRSPIATISLAIAVLLFSALEVYRFRYPEAAHRTLGPLAARARAAIHPQPASASEERRRLQMGAIDRPDPALSAASSSSDSASSESVSSVSVSSDSADELGASSSSSAESAAPVEHVAGIAALHKSAPAKPSPKPRARAPKRLAQRSAAPPPPAAADPAPVPAAPPPVAETPAAPVADELAEVRSKDPAAAEHITSYCTTVAKTSVDGGAACRRSETFAWKQFVLTSNHARIYEEVRLRCPPSIYPDSYQGKEACVKHESGFRPRFE